MKVKVRCEIFVEVDVPDDIDPIFYIEENNCPGSGKVYLALQKLIEKHENSPYCEFCAAQCNTYIVNELVCTSPPEDKK